MVTTTDDMRVVPVWDLTVRWFHWINVLAVLALAAAGTVILYAEELGIPPERESALKAVHTLMGYVFVLNLAWRLVWAFVGGRYSRWRAFLPFGRGWLAETKAHIAAIGGGAERPYAGHDPLARLAVTLLLMMLAAQAVTGLVLAGTDIFYPPFGRIFASWVAAPGVDPAAVAPNRPELVDAAARTAMRAFRKPFKVVHEYAFYCLSVFVALHVAAVALGESRGTGTLVSAMFSGRKILRGDPVDAMEKDR
jgi:cytochrome b